MLSSVSLFRMVPLTPWTRAHRSNMTKNHTQALLAIAVLVILYLWWKRKAVVTSTFTAGAPVSVGPETQILQETTSL